jgi:hypothetical protein
VGVRVLLLTACGADDDGEPASGAAAGAGTAAPAELPEAEDVSDLPGQIPGEPFPDFALALDDVVWISGVEPGSWATTPRPVNSGPPSRRPT